MKLFWNMFYNNQFHRIHHVLYEILIDENVYRHRHNLRLAFPICSRKLQCFVKTRKSVGHYKSLDKFCGLASLYMFFLSNFCHLIIYFIRKSFLIGSVIKCLHKPNFKYIVGFLVKVTKSKFQEIELLCSRFA